MATRILRKGPISYSQQPPSTVPPMWGLPINRQLLYASSIPYEAVWVRNAGANKPTLVTGGTASTFAYSEFGKLSSFATTIQGNEVIGTIMPTPPFTMMACINIVTTARDGSILAFQGASTAGLAMEQTSTSRFKITFGGVADYIFATLGPIANVDCVLIIKVTANGGTATPWFIRKDTNAISTDTGITVGTALASTQPLTIGNNWDTTYFDSLGGKVGSFAIWDRALSDTECISILNNPYQIWAFEVGSPNTVIAATVNQPSIQFNTQFTARW